MREILFRGKQSIGYRAGEWVEGYYIVQELREKTFHHIQGKMEHGGGFNVHVEPETVGQYTGLCDKNGKKIFEGDVLRRKDVIDGIHLRTMCVSFQNGAYLGVDNYGYMNDLLEILVSESGEVIGNIHDNPELLEE